VQSGGTNWVAIAAIIATPVTAAIGAAAGFVFGTRRDRLRDERQFAQALRSQAADDLILLIDQIEQALEMLRRATADLRNKTGHPDGYDLGSLDPLFTKAVDQHDAAVAQIARLRLRPRASESMVAKAQEAADSYLRGIQAAGGLLLKEMLGELVDDEDRTALNHTLHEQLREGVRITGEFETVGRATLGELLPT
jgi:hypothetical protein